MYMSEVKEAAESDVSCEADANSMKKKDVLSVTPRTWRREGLSPLPGRGDREAMTSREEPEHLPDESGAGLPVSPHSSHRDSGYVASPSPASVGSPSSLTPRERHFQFELGAVSDERRTVDLPRFRSTSCTSIEEVDETVDEGMDSDGGGDDEEDNVVFDLNPTFLEPEGAGQSATVQPQLNTFTLRNMTEPVSIPTTSQSAPTPFSYENDWSPMASPASHSFPGLHRYRAHSTPVTYQGFSPLLPGSRLQPGSYTAHRSDLVSSRRSISTQTPNPHSQMIQHAIRWQSSQSSSPAQQQQPSPRAHVIARGRAVERFRTHSQGDANDDDKNCDEESYPLPDIIQFHRDRSQSEPAVPAWQRTETERRFGQELRRISDEFHNSYISARQGRNQNMPRASSFPGTQGEAARPLWQSILRYFSRQQQPAPERNCGRPRAQSASSLWE